MQTTGIFTKFNYEIHVKKIGEPIYLVPFGDVHRSSPMCHIEKWHEFLDWGKKKPRCLFLGMGDYDDLGSSSERKILMNPDLHESSLTTLEDLYRKHVSSFAKEISFMNGNLIGFIEGNHYGQFADGTTTTQKLCELAKAKYLGVSSFIRLSFSYGQKRTSVDIWAHHGKGAARLVGGSINRIQQMGEAAEADIYLMGHDHKKAVGMTTKLYLTNGQGLELRQRKQLYIRTGSFLKAYEDNRSSYVADAAMNPTDLGVVKIEMTPKRERHARGKGNPTDDHFYVDLHASI